jgi:ATP-dependent DNA helicase RecQ
MDKKEIDLRKELKKYFGFDQFKGLQEEVVTSIIENKNTFLIMPTGGG